MDNRPQRKLTESTRHAEGLCGGFSFGGQQPDGVGVCSPLPTGTQFPNGASAALLLTFDVEGTYGNGAGDMQLEIANYRRICRRLSDRCIPATFNVLGQMADEQGPDFVLWMIQAGCEVASHGYFHELNLRYGGDKVYAGHYGAPENLAQVRDGIEALNRISAPTGQAQPIRGIRMPYGHFNEFTYRAIGESGLTWASNVGIDDFVTPGNGFGGAPFEIKLGDEGFGIVEIPLDSQTFDWPIWLADEEANPTFVQAVREYCAQRDIPFDRTPAGGVAIWYQRMEDTIERQGVFTLLSHPINLTAPGENWSDPVVEFMFPVIDRLGELHRDGSAWVCTCGQLAEFYRQTVFE